MRTRTGQQKRWESKKARFECPVCDNTDGETIARLRPDLYHCEVCGTTYDPIREKIYKRNENNFGVVFDGEPTYEISNQGGEMSLTKEEWREVVEGSDKRLKRSWNLMDHPRQGKYKGKKNRKDTRFGMKDLKIQPKEEK